MLKPHILKKDPEFLEMAGYLLNGMWAMNPTLEVSTYFIKLHSLLQGGEYSDQATFEMTLYQKFYMIVVKFTIWSLQFRIFRVYFNLTQVLAFWLMEVFPFLAYYKYGYANSHVRVLPNYNVNNN